MSIMSQLPSKSVIEFSSSNRDAFGLARFGQSMGVYEHKNLHSRDSSFMREKTVAGGTITYKPLESQVELAVGTGATDRAVRETPYTPYISGNAQRIAPTVVLAPAKVNNGSRIGYFNDNDGAFFERNEADIRVVIRSSVSGAVLDTNFFIRDQWDDKLDGTGPSRKTVDFTKGFLPIVEIAWQGYVGVRFGVKVDGEPVYCKTYYHSGDVPFMATPSLPCRYEIYNTGVTSSASSMKECCLTIRSEGGGVLPGIEWSADNFFSGGALRNVPVATPQFVLAVRMAPTFNGKTNRRLAQLIASDLYAETNPARAIVYHVHSDYSATLNGAGAAATWTALHADSAIQVSRDIASITGGTLHPVHNLKAAVGVGGSTALAQSHPHTLNYHGQISNNMDATVSEMFAVYVARTGAAGATDVCAGFDLIEIE